METREQYNARKRREWRERVQRERAEGRCTGLCVTRRGYGQPLAHFEELKRLLDRTDPDYAH